MRSRPCWRRRRSQSPCLRVSHLECLLKHADINETHACVNKWKRNVDRAAHFPSTEQSRKAASSSPAHQYNCIISIAECGRVCDARAFRHTFDAIRREELPKKWANKYISGSTVHLHIRVAMYLYTRTQAHDPTVYTGIQFHFSVLSVHVRLRQLRSFSSFVVNRAYGSTYSESLRFDFILCWNLQPNAHQSIQQQQPQQSS